MAHLMHDFRVNVPVDAFDALVNDPRIWPTFWVGMDSSPRVFGDSTDRRWQLDGAARAAIANPDLLEARLEGPELELRLPADHRAAPGRRAYPQLPRLNRRGNRQLNCALDRIAVTQLRTHEPAQAFLARKHAEGKSKREALRCLKRHLACTVWKTLRAAETQREAMLASSNPSTQPAMTLAS